MEKEGRTRESEHRIMLIHNGTSMEPTHSGPPLIIVMFKWLPGAHGGSPCLIRAGQGAFGSCHPAAIITQDNSCSQTCPTQVWEGWGTPDQQGDMS